MHLDRRLLGWGLFLVIAGGISLIVRAGAIPRDALEGWTTLWPLFLIGSGVGLLFAGTPVRHFGGLISVVTAGIMVGGLLTVGFHGFPAFGSCGAGSRAPTFTTVTGTLNDRASVDVDLSCGTLDVIAVDGNTWSVAGRNPDGRAPTIDASTQSVRIESRRGPNISFDSGAASWQVRVPRASVLDLGVTLNAGSSELDLAGAQINSLILTMNAGSVRTDLSAADAVASVRSTVNAGSAELLLPAGVSSVGLTLNAGSFTVCLPASAEVDVNWSGALAGNNFGSIGLIKVDDDHWRTSDLGASFTRLTVSANAGSFTLLFGDACDA